MTCLRVLLLVAVMASSAGQDSGPAKCGPSESQSGGVARFVCVNCTATGHLSSRRLFLNRAGVRRHIAASKACFAADRGFKEIHVEALAGYVMAGAGVAAGPAPESGPEPDFFDGRPNAEETEEAISKFMSGLEGQEASCFESLHTLLGKLPVPAATHGSKMSHAAALEGGFIPKMNKEQEKRFTPSELLLYKHAVEYRYLICICTLDIHSTCMYIHYSFLYISCALLYIPCMYIQDVCIYISINCTYQNVVGTYSDMQCTTWHM